ncbi:hypothetical protein ScPMuIL_005822 [Solemya velum]
MAERKAVNKYYPPDWDPRKGSVNKHVGQHPLRDRARKLSQGILIIRFEMPYNIWCGGCNSHIGMGVRYNAEKKKVGNYYTTPIYKFRMKCHLCPNHFEIQTDPKNHDYVIVCGAQRKEQRWDPKENEQVVPEDKETHKKMATDAMFKLEHGTDDRSKGQSRVPSLGEIEGYMSMKKDDYLLNRLARDKFRTEKMTIIASKAEEKALQVKSSLDVPLVPETQDDRYLAGLLKYKTLETYDERQKQKREMIENQSIFQSTTQTINKKTDLKQKLAETVSLSQGNRFDSSAKFKMDTYTTEQLGIRRKQASDKVLAVSSALAKSCDNSGTILAKSCDNSSTIGDGMDCLSNEPPSSVGNTSGLGLVSAYCDSDSDRSSEQGT